MKAESAITPFINVIGEIEKADNIIIVSHENPDGDSVGSSLALWYYCRSKQKNADIVFHNNVPDDLHFLPDLDKILIYSELPDDRLIEKADLILIVDVNTIARLATLGRAVNTAACRKVMVDHHREPEDIANIFLSYPDMAAAGEIVWQLLHSDPSYKMTTEVAVCLYTAILTDTGGFQFGNTSTFTHAIAADLMNHDIHAQEIFDKIYNSIPRNIFLLLGRAYTNSKTFFEGKVNVMTVTRKDLIDLQVCPENLNNFPEKTLIVQGATIGIMMTEMIKRNGVKVSFRSKGEIDIRQIASFFGGGGHRNAAGAKIYNVPTSIVLRQILEKIASIL